MLVETTLFRAAVEFILLSECGTWSLTKSEEKILDGCYTRMLRKIYNLNSLKYQTMYFTKENHQHYQNQKVKIGCPRVQRQVIASTLHCHMGSKTRSNQQRETYQHPHYHPAEGHRSQNSTAGVHGG